MFFENTSIALVIGSVVRMGFGLDDGAPLSGLVLGDEHDVIGNVFKRMRILAGFDRRWEDGA